MKRISFAALALASFLAAAPASAATLVTNGDFEAGNTGFTSDYTFRTGGNTAAAEYTVGTNPKAFNSNFVTAGDNTTGTGNMLIVNGSQNLNDIVWQSQIIPISSLTDYFFEAFVMSVFPRNPSVLTFTVSLDGGPETVLNTFNLPRTTGEWNGLSTTFNSGSATNATLRLKNAQTAFGGNDFAVDDISLSVTSVVNPAPAIPEPSTWLMMMLGLGVVGGTMRLAKKRHIARFA
ncbi:MAG: PEPxxWA-CTERM sorting domain-containing protein [Pseudomonadota bacterium]